MRLTVKAWRSERWHPVCVVANCDGPWHAREVAIRSGRVSRDERVAVEQQSREDSRLEVFEASALAQGAA